ncbi:MAG: hypothetical protein E6Q97_03060 [Desulfurellales bacterium]|nr:MAG: hypothetical protein E6Q97_03060 [Desulfurellales bacterium]
MTERVASLYAEIGAKTDGLKAGLAQAKSGLAGFAANAKQTLAGAGEAWAQLATPINQTIQILGQVGAAAQQAYAFVSEGTQLARTEEQFGALSKSIGTTSDALLGELKTATNGTISDFKLMESATSIMSLGLADTSEETVRLASLVGKLGWDMNQVTLTLANQSTMRLDSLGLSVEDVTGRIDALKEAGYSADQAFKFAILEAGEEKVKLLGDAAETAAGKLKILEANTANYKDNLQSTFSQQLITYVNDFSGGLFETADGASEAGKSIGELAADAIALGLKIRTAADVVEDLTGATGKLSGALRQSKNAVQEERAAVIASLTAYDDRREAIESNAAVTEDAIFAERQFDQQLRTINRAIVAYGGSLEATSEPLDELYYNTHEATTATRELGETIPTVTGYVAQSAEAMAAYAASTGEYFMAASEGELSIDTMNQRFIEQIAAAGGSAQEIGAAALALGTMSEAQVEAALKAAELEIRIAGVRQAYLDGRLSAEDLTGAIQQQIEIVNGMTTSIGAADGSVRLIGDSMMSAAGDTQTLLDKFGLFPDEISTTVNVDTGDAESRVTNLYNKLKELGDPAMPSGGGGSSGGGSAGGGGGGYQGPGDIGEAGQSSGTGYGGGGNIPHNAGGTDFFPGGRTWVGERGPEIVTLPRGSQITSAEQSKNMMGGNNITMNLYVTATDGGAAVSREFNYMKGLLGV